MQKSTLKLILVAPDYSLYQAFQQQFKYLPNVEIAHCGFEQLPAYDCLVSPANSFGMMDGGMDAAITDFFGIALMNKVQQRILDDYWGEQPVGTSFIIETDHPSYPFLAHTPTMRVPMQIVGTDIPYVAMWAMLLAVAHHNRLGTCAGLSRSQSVSDRRSSVSKGELRASSQLISTIACPGFGTGIGRIPPNEAARQMALAYDHFLYPPKFLNCFVAATRQLQIWEG
jgi:O-acetyl-ADP-ribose deacetylase (regulator of RNase III)